MSKSSRRREAARQQAVQATDDGAQSAADRVGAIAHSAADRVGPLAQSAADRVGPLAEAAAERLGAVADKVSPLAHTAAERISPWAHTAADRVGPLSHSAADRIVPLAAQAADRVSPYAHQAAGLVTPYAQQAAGLVTPYAHQAAEFVTPYAQQAAVRLAPLASTARERGAQVAHSAAERLGPRLDDALDRVGPAVEGARGKVTDDLLPKLSETLSAAGAAVVAEAAKRGVGTVAVPVLPEPKKKGRWVKRIAIVAAVAAIVALVARRFLGRKDADWQAARPSTPYTPAQTTPTPADTPVTTPLDVPQSAAGDDPQAGLSAHEASLAANGQAEPDAPAEGGDVADEAPVGDVVADTSLTEEAPVEDFAADTSDTSLTQEAPVEEPLDRAPATAGEPVDSGPPPETPTAEIPEGALLAADVPTPSNESDVLDDLSEPSTEATERPRYDGEGVYVGDEPPEGYVIKGNERSKKYHLPESSGYARTIAEVWFNSEEAAQAAGFVRAQR